MNRSARPFHFSPWPIALALSAVALAVGVFVVTQGVQARESKVAEMNRQLLNEQQTLRVLDAEWAYLTRPQRLEDLIAMKDERGMMPPAPAPVANVVPEITHAAAPVVVAAVEEPAEATPAPVAATVSEKPETPVAQAKAVEKKAEPVKTVSKKTETKAPVKTAAKAMPAKKTMVAKATTKKATPVDDVWRIARKLPAQIAPAAGYAAPRMPMARTAQAPVYQRAGIARPIVE